MIKWQDRLLNKLGLVAGTPEANDALSGARKHGRQCQRPRNYEDKKKAKRQAAKKARQRGKDR